MSIPMMHDAPKRVMPAKIASAPSNRRNFDDRWRMRFNGNEAEFVAMGREDSDDTLSTSDSKFRIYLAVGSTV
jgi:hypothetical protein